LIDIYINQLISFYLLHHPKTIQMFENLTEDKDKYAKFWKEYGKNVRLGILDDATNRKRLIDLCRYQSSKTNTTSEELTSLKEYVSRMKPGQKHIYYIAGESIESVKKSPFLEELESRDLEVLYFVDPIDEYVLQHLTEYDSKPLQSTTREGLEFGDETDKKTQLEEDQKTFEPLTKFMKKVLPEEIMNAQLSSRINKSPVVLVAPKYGFTANMERIIKAQALGDNNKDNNPYAQYMKGPNKIMEINPKHPVIIELNNRIKSNDEDPEAKRTIELLYQTASLRSGYPIKNQEDFAERIFELMKRGSSLSLKEALKMEYRTGFRMVRRNDILEGVKSILIAKEREHIPKWNPGTIEEIKKWRYK